MDNQSRRYPYAYGQPSSITESAPAHSSHLPPPPPPNAQPIMTKEIYQYDAPWPLYALDWCKVPNERKGFRMALGSLIEESHNKVYKDDSRVFCIKTDLVSTVASDRTDRYA